MQHVAASPIGDRKAVPAYLQDYMVWWLIGAGTLIRAAVAVTNGLPYDVQSWDLVRSAFASHPLHVYSLVNPDGNFHWPYPPGFFPLMLVMSGVSDVAGGAFDHLVRTPSILADGAIAWLVWIGLERRVSRQLRLVAVGVVAFGPVFIVISGYSAQIDSVAILPAVAALLVWERGAEHLPGWERGAEHLPGWERGAFERRAVIAGLLIGVAAAVKTVPLAMILALAPSARSRRELVTLVGCAVAVLALTLAPFLIADPSGVKELRHYTGSPGMGGLSVVLQPDLAQRWLTRLVAPTGLTQWLLISHAGVYNAVVLAAFAAYGWRWRPEPRVAAALLWLIVLAFGSGFFFQYLVWGLPFFLLAGYVRATALLQLVVSVPMVIYYLGPWPGQDAIVYVYVPLMIAVWVGWVTAAATLARRSVLRHTG